MQFCDYNLKTIAWSQNTLGESGSLADKHFASIFLQSNISNTAYWAEFIKLFYEGSFNEIQLIKKKGVNFI